MAYQDTTQKTAVDFFERIALLLSRRADRSELAAAFFAEFLASTGAKYAVLWRCHKSEPWLQAQFWSLEITLDKTLSFDPSGNEFWNLWTSGSSLLPSILQFADAKKPKSPFARFNLLFPLTGPDGSLIGMLSVHHDDLQTQDNIFSPVLNQLIVNSLFSRDNDSLQMGKELWLELNMRVLSNRIHSKVDHDFVLQTAVDTLGNILKVSSCLVLRHSPGAPAKITHEYVDPGLSPLGLGWSSAIPVALAEQMCQRTTVLEETGVRKHEPKQYVEGMESLFESSVRSLSGTPILINGTSFGALVVQSNKERKWLQHELKLIESAATSIGTALRNAQLYQEAKEQVFNLNLLSNLSRQLSSAVEQLSKHPQLETEQDAAQAPQTKLPLSARELEVLRLISSGLANKEIAQRLFLTESTVELHASRIRKKLKLKSRTALVKFACDNHLV